MKLSSPLPQTLAKECIRAAQILKEFVDKSNNGLDGIIPGDVLEQAKGFAVLTVIKAGLLFSARAGSGLVIVKLRDGSWSAPSAIGTAGMGLGGQLGAEVTEFLIVLNSRAACQQFMSAGSFSLGGNISVAIGPLGRNGEASASLSSRGGVAAMYSYSRSKGLFGGISIEGSVIINRDDANTLAYKSPVSVQALLTGAVPRPPWTDVLVQAIEGCTVHPGIRKWVDDRPTSRPGPGHRPYSFGGLGSPGKAGSSAKIKKTKGGTPNFPPAHWGTPKEGGSYFDERDPTPDVNPFEASKYSTPDTSPRTSFDKVDDNFSRHLVNYKKDKVIQEWNGGMENEQRPATVRYQTAPVLGSNNPFANTSGGLVVGGASLHTAKATATRARATSTPTPEDSPSIRPLFRFNSLSSPRTKATLEQGGFENQVTPVSKAIAMYDFKGVEPGDLPFRVGDVIVILSRTESTQDWWKGRLRDREGLFPANFVELIRDDSKNPFY